MEKALFWLSSFARLDGNLCSRWKRMNFIVNRTSALVDLFNQKWWNQFYWERKKETIKPLQSTFGLHLSEEMIRAGRSQSFPLCLQTLWEQHKKHPEPINTMTTAHESAGSDGCSASRLRPVQVFFSTSSGLQVAETETGEVYLSSLLFFPLLSSIHLKNCSKFIVLVNEIHGT